MHDDGLEYSKYYTIKYYIHLYTLSTGVILKIAVRAVDRASTA